MPSGRAHIRGFLRHLHVQNGGQHSKTFTTYILQALCGRYVCKRKRDKADTLFYALNLHHPNITFPLEQNPKRFLDTQIIKENNQIKTQVFVKKSMYSLYWSSKCRFDIGKMQLMVSYTFDSKMVF